MPIYDYRCEQCGTVWDILVRNSYEDEVKCPVCSSQSVERIISASHIMKIETREPGTTCCGRTERCETPPCSMDETCRKR